MINIDIDKLEDNLIITNKMNEGAEAYSNLTLVGGLAGSGKSWYALKQVVKAIEEDKSVLLFSTEMTPEEVSTRLLILMTKIKIQDVDKKENKDRLLNAVVKLKKAKLLLNINMKSDLNLIMEIMKEAGNSIDGLDVIVIDRLILNPSGSKLSAHHQITDANHKLNKLAYDLGCKVRGILQA